MAEPFSTTVFFHFIFYVFFLYGTCISLSIPFFIHPIIQTGKVFDAGLLRLFVSRLECPV